MNTDKLKGLFVEVLNRDHGKEIIKTFQKLGVKTTGFYGHNTKEGGFEYRFYGVSKSTGKISICTEQNPGINRIITLEELKCFINEYPKLMLVSSYPSFSDGCKRVVFMEKLGKFLAQDSADSFEKAEKTTGVSTWNYAKDIIETSVGPSTIEVTIEEIAKMKGVKPEQIRIKE